jgi:hypothetical protein
MQLEIKSLFSKLDVAMQRGQAQSQLAEGQLGDLGLQASGSMLSAANVRVRICHQQPSCFTQPASDLRDSVLRFECSTTCPCSCNESCAFFCVQNWAATAQANMLNYRSSGVFSGMSGMSSSLLSGTDSKSFMADTKQFAAKTKDFMGKSTALFRGKFGASNRASGSATK